MPALPVGPGANDRCDASHMTGLPTVRFIEHTADVGIEVDAATLAGLFLASAAGMSELLLGDAGATAVPPDVPVETRRITLQADDAGGLLIAWLRELLFVHETSGLGMREARFEILDESRLDASVEFVEWPPAVREIKAVTWHQLDVRRTDHTWHARVIFDV